MGNHNDNFDLNHKSQNPYSYQESGLDNKTFGSNYPSQMPYGNMGYPPQMPYGGMGYPPQMPYGPYGNMKPYDPGKGKGVASMILGIASIIMMCTFYGIISFICGVTGLVLSKLSEKESGYQRNGFATAGLICSVIGIAISMLWLIFFVYTLYLVVVHSR